MPSRNPVLRLLLAGMVVLCGVRLPAAEPLSQSPYDTNPALRELMDAVTFHHSFDHDSLLPDMAVGDFKPQKSGDPELAPGLIGKALVAGTGALAFPDPDNWTIGTRGSLAVWVSPVEWNHQQAGNTNFVVSWGGAFYLERQGPIRNPDGTWKRNEALLVGTQRGPRGSRGAGCRDWQPGRWHLLAVNWSWPQLALSVDGGAFRAVVLPGKPDPKLFGGLVVGSRGGDRTLVDEFFCFNRPLSETEVHDLFEALRPRERKGTAQ